MKARQLIVIAAVLAAMLLLATGVLADKPDKGDKGFDEWGYNHQARLFRGEYCDSSQTSEECALEGARLIMKWDKEYRWITNHISGEYWSEEGRRCTWQQFFKIAATPEDAVLNHEDGMWYVDGSPVGRAFAPTGYTELTPDWMVIQEVLNDQCAGFNGVQYLSPAGPGLGLW